MSVIFSESSSTFRAILIRATAAFTYLLIFSVIPHHWWTAILMWLGLVALKWVDSVCPYIPPKK